MTFDERMERITERHESLAQSFEMLVIENRATGEKNPELGKIIGQGDKQLSELGKFTNEIALGTARLLSIAGAHEHRITRIEGQL